MVILDTDHLSIFDQDTSEGFNLSRRLAALPEAEVAVTIITYEEQIPGWQTYAALTLSTLSSKNENHAIEDNRNSYRFAELYHRSKSKQRSI
jgi:hypothetical protein